MVSGNNAPAAVKKAIEKTPTSKSDEVKRQAAEVIGYALTSVGKDAIDNVIKDLDDEGRSTCMKYVYKCMSFGDKKMCDSLLLWHSKLYAVVRKK